MNLKHFFIISACIGLPAAAMAQDKMFKSNGEVSQVRIKNVGSRQITFKHYDNLSGPDYVIPKDEVDKIRYENGTEETFTNGRSNGRVSSSDIAQSQPGGGNGGTDEHCSGHCKYKPNIIAVAPIQFTEEGIAGFSFSYERALDKNGIVAFYVPAIAEFSTNNNYNSYSGTHGDATDKAFYVMPGIKLYPTGSYGTVKYAIGPSFVVAGGSKTDYGNYYYGYNYTSQSIFKLGMMINQSVNINPTAHLYLGTEFGFGFTYLNKLGGVSQGTGGLVQFAFKLGYRF